MNTKCTINLTLLFAICFSAQAQTQVVKIWPNLAPGTETMEDQEQWRDGKSVIDVYQPDLTVFLPEQQAAPSPVVMVFPGGGYRQVVMEKEGYKVARWLNENGIAAFVLKYRLNPEQALRDAQRAISLIRKEADKYHIDKNKIGVIGFSAGAHLAGNLVFNHQNRENYDEVDLFSSRPDFWIGIYGSYKYINLPDQKVSDQVIIPPAFLVHAGNDSKVPVEASVELYSELKKRGVPAELHIYEQGEHGFALETNRGDAVTSTVTAWSRRCLEWLKLREIL